MAPSDGTSQQQLYLGIKADLSPGDLVEPGHAEPAAPDGEPPHIELVDSLDAASWQAALAPGEGPARIYTVEPTGPATEDPEPAGRKYPVQAKSYRTGDAVRVTGACTDEQGHPLRLYHGTKADLKPGDVIEPGRSPNFGELDRLTKYVYFTGTLDAAIWGAELAIGEGRGRIYAVEPTGPIADDPNLTDQKYPCNPTKSYRSQEPLRVIGEVADWQGHPPELVRAMKAGIEELQRKGFGPVDD